MVTGGVRLGIVILVTGDIQQMLDGLKNKTRQEKLNDAMSAMANLHEAYNMPHFYQVHSILLPILVSNATDLLLDDSRMQVNRYNAEVHLKGDGQGPKSH